MAYVIDTGVLLRAFEASDPHYKTVRLNTIITLNPKDFRRYPRLTVLTPEEALEI